MKRLFCLAAVAIGANGAITTGAASADTLNGAGSTLVAPLVSEWKTGFQNANSGDSVNYAAVGSGTGITDISHGVVDFGASDAPMSAAQAGGCSGCITIPWALSATGIGYNVRGVKSGLKLTGPILAEIYLGQITTWNNAAIAKLNKGVKLPALKITPVFRSDGSGDTYAFANFLAHVSPTWASKMGPAATTMGFSVGNGGKGNSGVAADVQSTSGAIGYISGSYLLAQHITYAAVKNAAGNYEYPNLNSILNAASSVTSASLGAVQTSGLPIVNPPKSKKIAYPISTFTYAIVKPGSKNSSLLKQFLTFAVTTGRQYGVGADFAPIPSVVQSYDESEIGKL